MPFRRTKDNLELGTTGLFGLSRLRVAESDRQTHTYVVGITGKGKSKLLEHILFQDIVSGRGCGVLDPHSDLVEDLLQYLHSHPEKALPHMERIIYVDPSRRDHLVPFNVLASDNSPYETAQNVVEAFRRTWPQALAEAPRFANIVTACVLTLIPNKLTLIEIPRVLTDTQFREHLLQRVSDPEVITFWRERYEKWGRETPVIIESVLNKVTAFTFNPQLRLILGADENRLNFRQIMDEGKVLLVDLGRCDAETRRLVGSLIVIGLEQAARSRKDARGNRRPFYFCIDEFQDFCANDGAAQTLAQILSECRKFGLHLTLAHQTLAQINERMKGALGNIQLKIVFGVSRQDAEILARHMFQVDGERIKHTVEDNEQQDRSHPVYYSLQEEWERAVQVLQNLLSRQAYAKCPGTGSPMCLKTIKVKGHHADEAAMASIKHVLAARHGMAVEDIVSTIERRVLQPREERNSKPLIRQKTPARESQETTHSADGNWSSQRRTSSVR